MTRNGIEARQGRDVEQARSRSDESPVAATSGDAPKTLGNNPPNTTPSVTEELKPMDKAVSDIAAERQRQIEVEGWTPEHDDKHDSDEMAKAAVCYALGTTRAYDIRGSRSVSLWPWGIKWWKPGADRRRQLVKAGALIVAEIERLDRATR